MVSVQNTSGVKYPVTPLNLVYRKNIFDNDEIRIEDQERAYYYYVGDKKEIEGYLKSVIARLFGNNLVNEDELIYDWTNLTKKLINQLAVVYRESAQRYILVDGEQDEDLTEYINSIYPEDTNTKDKKAHRFAKLLNTSFTQVVFDKEKGRMDFVIEPTHKFKVEIDDNDPYKITLLKYLKYFKNDKGEDELYTVVWTDETHYKEDTNGNKTAIGNNFDMVNPYGVIPFAMLMMESGEDIWGIGALDVVDANELINVLLTVLVNDHILGGNGLLITTNLDLRTKGTEENGLIKVRTGRRHPIQVEDARTENATPSAQYVTPPSLITEIRDSIDYRIKQVALIKGLNPNSFLADVQATSGYSKIIDSLEQLEIRRDDIEPCRTYEHDRFEIIRRVNNAAYLDAELKSKFDLQEIPEDVELRIDFAEIKVEKTPAEIMEDRRFKLEHNMETPVDWLRQENPDLTEDQAIEIIENNKSIRQRYLNDANKPMSVFDKVKDRILNNQKGTQDE